MSASLRVVKEGDTAEAALAAVKSYCTEHGFPEPKDIHLSGPCYGQRKWFASAASEWSSESS